MSSDNSTQNLFYIELQHQNGGGPCAALIVTAVLLNAVGIPGFLMNLSVVFVTAKHRSLHGSANFLLALSSLFEMGHEMGHLLFLWLALSGQNFVAYAPCFRMMALPVFCIGGIFASMLCTGIDRMISVLIPNVHARLNLFLYLSAHCAFCFALCTYIFVSFWHCADLYPLYPVTGYISDLIIGECAPMYTYSSFVANLITIVMYLLVGLAIWLQSSYSQSRLFRSLVVIILANIGGYFYVSIMRAFVIPALNLSITNQWYINSYDGILLNVSSACNAPVLFFLSKDYRAAYQKEFGILCRLLHLHTNPSPSSAATAGTTVLNRAGTITVKQAATVACIGQKLALTTKTNKQ